ncbi:MAG: hypothetical protein V5A57_03440 [Candidatus Paceibacterota bacterium]
MDNKKLLIAAALASGLFVGVTASVSIDSDDKCEKVEQQIRQETNLSGALACFQSGALEVNQSERVEKNANLECVCRRSSDAGVQIWAINRAKS